MLQQKSRDGSRRMAKPKQGDKAVRRGRPALPKGAGKRHALGLRATAECRKALEEAAASSGRSISQEIEFRLERSFHQDAEFGGREMAGLFRMMAGAAALISERRGGKPWSTDWESFQAVSAAWRELMNQVSPNMPAEWKARFQTLKSEDPGPPPALPVLGGESLGLLSDLFAADPASSQDRQRAMKKWARDKEDWESRMRNYRQKLDADLRRLEELDNLGRETARSPLGRAIMVTRHEDQ
jgi:hypothetical protein